MSIRCAMGWHSWKPQYLRLPYYVTAQSFFGPYETKNHYRGDRCKRCRKWNEIPKPVPYRLISHNATLGYKLREQQKNAYLSALASGLQSNANRIGGLGHNQGCNCCCNRGAPK